MIKYLARKLHHYILPHESNNFRARALHNSAVIFYIVLLISFQFSMKVLNHVQPDILGFATDITGEKILSLINQKRLEANLQPLSISDQLSVAATQKADDMFSKDYWAHMSPTGTTPWVFINDAGYQYVYAGENLARNFSTADEVVEAWMNSPTHRANIMKPEYKEIGLSVMNGKLNGEETTLVVQEFGARAAAPVADTKPDELANLKASSPVSLGTENNIQTSSLTQKVYSLIPRFNKTFSLVVAEFMLVVLFIDSIYLWKFKTQRLSSHSLAHIIFLFALIGAMAGTGLGVIL